MHLASKARRAATTRAARSGGPPCLGSFCFFRPSGSALRLKMTGCYTFAATKEGLLGASELKGWIPVKHVSMEYTGWREAGGCRL